MRKQSYGPPHRWRARREKNDGKHQRSKSRRNEGRRVRTRRRGLRGEINDGLLWESVKHYRAALRQGTAATKTRKRVSGAGKKLWKQKGTGRARVGSIRTPLWRGGGTVHGPQPRSYEYAFPQKKLMGALRSAIAAKIADGKFTIVDSFEVAEAKTKLFRTALNKLEAGKTTLLVGVQPQARREALPRFAQPGGR